MSDISNLLYIYLQKKLLESANSINNKRYINSEEDKEKLLEQLKSSGKLNTTLPFSEAKRVLNYWYNIPNKIVVPTLYVMRDLKLLKIDGKFQSMKVEIINIHKGKLLSKPNKIYSVCF